MSATPPDRIRLARPPKKLLVIKPSSLGDIVHSLPFLQAIRDIFPAAQIHWVVAKGLEGLLEAHPMVNRLWVINKDRWKDIRRLKDTLPEWQSLLRGLKAEGFDLVIDLQGLLRSGVLSVATGAPVRIGFSEAREGSVLFYTHKVKGGRDVHAVDRYLKMASALGADCREAGFPMPLYRESEQIRKVKEEVGRYAVIVPGARWETKKWDPERFGALASMISISSVIVGTAADKEASQIIEDRSGGKALSLAGRTDLRELISLIRGARYVVSNDSGPMHIAAAFGIPVFAIFGPTNPVRTGPYGGSHRVVKSEAHCAPCYRRKCRDLSCMKQVSAEGVYAKIVEHMKEET